MHREGAAGPEGSGGRLRQGADLHFIAVLVLKLEMSGDKGGIVGGIVHAVDGDDQI